MLTLEGKARTLMVESGDPERRGVVALLTRAAGELCTVRVISRVTKRARRARRPRVIPFRDPERRSAMAFVALLSDERTAVRILVRVTARATRIPHAEVGMSGLAAYMA